MKSPRALLSLIPILLNASAAFADPAPRIDVLMEYDSDANPKLVFRIDGRAVDTIRIDGLSYQPAEAASALERRLNQLVRAAFYHPTDRPAIRISTASVAQIQPSLTFESWIGSGTKTLDRAQQVIELPPTEDDDAAPAPLSRFRARFNAILEAQRARSLAGAPRVLSAR